MVEHGSEMPAWKLLQRKQIKAIHTKNYKLSKPYTLHAQQKVK